jgi:hypothetical protein
VRKLIWWEELMPIKSGFVGLNTLLPSHTVLTLIGAVGINDSRQIPCDAKDGDGLEPAVQLSPKALR